MTPSEVLENHDMKPFFRHSKKGDTLSALWAVDVGVGIVVNKPDETSVIAVGKSSRKPVS